MLVKTVCDEKASSGIVSRFIWAEDTPPSLEGRLSGRAELETARCEAPETM